MKTAKRYRVIAWWTSRGTGLVKSDSAPNAIHFTAPSELGGLDGRWTAEDLLLAALAGCYTTTLRALAENSRLVYTDLEIEVQGTPPKTGSGGVFSRITIRAKITTPHCEQRESLLQLLQKAEAVCLISRSLSVPQTFELSVLVSQPNFPLGSAASKSAPSK